MLPVTKQVYAKELKKWISHKRVLAKTCKYYMEHPRLESMCKIWDLYVMLKNDCDGFGLSTLFSMVRQNEVHLRNILPVMLNDSYDSSLMKLEELLMIAKEQK